MLICTGRCWGIEKAQEEASPPKLQRGICILLKQVKLHGLHHGCFAPPQYIYATMPMTCKRNVQSQQIDRYGASNDYLFALSTAAELKLVIIRPAGGAGVLDRVGGADRLCAMCALTR